MRKQYFFIIVFLSLIMNSCELDINKDPNYPDAVDADKYISSGQMWTASVIGGDLQLLGGMWAQHFAQNANSNQYTGIDSYNLPNSSNYITRTWGSLYAGALPDFQLAISKAEVSGDWHYWMISKIMTAYCFHILADAYGNIPFSEALDFEKYKSPVFDEAKTVNIGIIAILDDALAKSAEAAAKASMGNADFVFNGDIGMWVKFAKSLKLKILMRDNDFASNKAAIQALLTEDNLLDEDCNITVFENQENKSNPLYENDRRKLNTPQNIRASSTISLFLHKNNDPRAAVLMERAETPDPVLGDYVGLPQGGYTLGSAYGKRTSRVLLKATDPVYFMSLAEVEFLKAEAYVLLNNPAIAKIHYENGVTAAFDRWRAAKDLNDVETIFPADIDVNNFIGAGKPYEFNQTSSETMLESIWSQKWIAAIRCQEWEAFMETNRTGYPKAGLVNSQDPAYVTGNFAPSINSVLGIGEFPRRLIYPKTSSDYNINTPVVIPIQTKLWWHK
ncbi:MAG: SusD/RagB family nutrient-binding outer membrane lipoprotein [Bacteroidetes bacterium]|nr:MAG: SusD/RagB family nutrient-binding outer membrane lipoprotein [Bacteroidota bacterium]